MNLLDLAVKITCDDQASGEVDKIGDGIKNKLGIAAKAGVAAVAAVGTAAVAIGKTALDAYSNYEQLVGGIDTLFKASSGKMQQYAANAYQTAGVSANRYMEISTSFAAALISSLGGNTEAAADMANTAITDMSDNANKMGTSLETVQEAYMSLSRGNYEMLDSLKLGYGGTKSELERLLSDAEKFSAAQGKVRDFSVDSYSDIVEAIHIVQDEMGITGTTAEEAATTIEGSVNMAKAAWDNWLAGLGNEDADMEGLTDQLVQSVVIAGKNIIPRVGQIMTTLGQTVADYAPGVGLYLRSALISVLPEAVQGPMYDAFAGVDKVVGKLESVFNDNLKPAADAADSVFSAISSGVKTFGDSVNDLVLPAIDQLSPAFEDFFGAIQAAQPLLEFIADIIGVGLAAAISTAIKLFAAITEVVAFVITGFAQLYEDISGFVTGVVQFFTADLPNAINTLVQWFAQLPGNIATFLSTVIANVAAWVANMAANAVNAGSRFISGIAGFLSALPGNVASWLAGVISTVIGWVSQFASNATSAATQFASNLIDGLASIPGQVTSIGSNIIQGLVNGVTGAAGKLIDAVKGAVGDAIEGAKNLLGIHSPSRVFREIGQYTMQGAALGVDDNADLLSKSTDNAMRGMISTAQDIAVPGVGDVAGGESAVISWLAENLPAIIAEFTPVMGESEFGRKARKAVAYA
jgi:phage-related protein|nr:MAG TPA: tail tape measure protein [Caudoviricetes sp.]